MPMEHLHVDPRLERGDDFYEALMDMHRDLSEEESRLANAKLILLLSNHIGDIDVLTEAMRIAREGVAANGA
ncbi:DUF2783 domain-containing protein [Arhodomonas sp. AD133]|uniref:DUF2783 domain-containing protein n=1 Tax=Arhodomonas sp. AD133 TaxID=3415009 RepID=UPI003EBDA121